MDLNRTLMVKDPLVVSKVIGVRMPSVDIRKPFEKNELFAMMERN